MRMSQKSRPQTDILVSNWIVDPIYSKINELIGDDATFVETKNCSQATFVVGMSPVVRPGLGPQVLRLRLNRSGDGPPTTTPVTITLLKGTTSIGSWIRFLATAAEFEEFEILLGTDQIALITANGGQYSDLNVRVSVPDCSGSSSSGGGIDFCGCFDIPTTLTATVSYLLGSGDLDGTITLSYYPPTNPPQLGYWWGYRTLSDRTEPVGVTCIDGVIHIGIDFGCATPFSGPAQVNCDPLQLQFDTPIIPGSACGCDIHPCQVRVIITA